MTVRKPWSDLTPREKDARVAAALGWVDFWSGSDVVCEYLMAYPPNEQAMGIEGERVPVPPFTTDHAACRLVLDEIKQRQLRYQYLYRLVLSVAPFICNDRFDEWESDTEEALWDFLHATPDQLCEVAATVLEEKVWASLGVS